VLALALYGYFWCFGEARPLTPGGLLHAFYEAKTEYVTAVLSATLTVLGFLLAFHTSTAAWRHQEYSKALATVADDIQNLFDLALHHLGSAAIYARQVVTTCEAVEKNSEDAAFWVEHTMSKTAAFVESRDALTAIGAQAFLLTGRHGLLLGTLPGATEKLGEAVSTYAAITGKPLWFRVPYAVSTPAEAAALFREFVRPTDCVVFANQAEQARDVISRRVGSLRGQLLMPILGFNFWTFLGVLRLRAELEAQWTSRQR
jgi:hypothetical protein